MKFSYVIGNPPYQNTITKSATDNTKVVENLFQKFQIEVDNVCMCFSCLIYPAGRWIQRSGRGLDSFGYNQINDKHLQSLIVFPNSTDVFPSVQIGDGLSIVIKNYKKNSEKFDYIYKIQDNTTKIVLSSPGDMILPLNPVDLLISKKIISFITKNKLNNLRDTINGSRRGDNLFGIASNFVELNPDKVKPFTDDSVLLSNECKIITNSTSGKAGRAEWYILDKKYIKNTHLLPKYKIIDSSSNFCGKYRHPEILQPNECFGRSKLVLRFVDTLEEANNCFNYINSNFILYGFYLVGGITNGGKFCIDFIDYTNNNKFIDFSKNIDEQMYKLLDLSPNEIKHIEEVIGVNEKVKKDKIEEV